MIDSKADRLKRARYLGLCLLGLVVGGTPAKADYKIRPGDVLGLTIIGMPDLATKATVDAEGNVTLPLAGDLPAAGLSIGEIKAKLQMILPSKEITNHLADGRQVPVIITPVQVNLTIAEYRPVYIDGDLGKPGAVPFRPGLTVRQAVALAGGIGPSRTKSDDPITQTVELTGKYNELSVTFAKTQARVARLRAELEGRRDIDPNLVAGLPVSAKLRDEIVATEQQLLTSRSTDFDKERTYLASASDREAQRADILNQQEVKDNEGVKIDEADLQRLEELFKKGAVAIPTLSEARRNVLQSSTRALQTTSAAATVQKDQEELARRLDRLGDTRRTEILLELSEATSRLAATRTELQTASTKLRYTGMVKPQATSGADPVKIGIVRDTDGTPRPVEAQLDTELQPGDALNIALPAEGTALSQ